MKVTYFHHSGFAVELAHTILVFDYYTEEGKKDFFNPTDKKYDTKEIIVFVSHTHSDHYDSRILNWSNRVSYVISDDVKISSPTTAEILWVAPNKNYTFHGLEITTLKSNDEGVAFLVNAEEKGIYFGGDLNWWHWNGEPDSFNNQIAKSYQSELEKIKGSKIHIAFVPVDSRLEDKFSWAGEYFLKEIGTNAFFPMHFWGDFTVGKKLKALFPEETIYEITKNNEEFFLV